MANFEIKGYDSYSGCDIVVTSRLSTLNDSTKQLEEKIYTLGSLQTLSVSTHQDKKPVRVIGSMNALDYTMGQRTIAGSLVFAVFDQHFATEMFNDLEKATGKTFFLPDELPAMDITITFANEYGRTSRMAIYGLRIINEGQVMSVNDLYTENTYQFVATAMEPLKKGTKAGSSSDKNNEPQVVSSFDLGDDMPTVGTGEDIWNEGNITDNEDLKRILLTVSVDQPMYEGQEGIAKFSLSPNQNKGMIYIYNQILNKPQTEIAVDGRALYSIYLESGLYSAWYEDKSKTLSNTVIFSIDNLGEHNLVYDDSPNIENITYSSIEIVSNNPTHITGVCINTTDNSIIELDLKNRECNFKNLNSNTNYVVYTKNSDTSSKTTLAKTLASEDSFISNFKTYVDFNKLLLSDDFDKYEEILETIDEKDDLIYSLERNQDIKAKELMYMAIKYKNEFVSIINSNKINATPKKNLDNIYGNSFIFNTGAIKANVFLVKNNREYYEHTEQYPSEMTYIGKSNKTYNVVSITNDFIKSPKYMFYSYSDNDKHKIKTLYGEANILKSIDLSDYIEPQKKYSETALKCLAIKDNKALDVKLLKAPTLYIDNNLNLIADIKYNDVIGSKEDVYYLAISNLEQSLDKTPFRKIKFTDKDRTLFVNSYLTAINKDDMYCAWIEDSNFNIVSEVSFMSFNEEIEDFNTLQLDELIKKIISKIEFNIGKTNSMSDIYSSIVNKGTSVKNLYFDILQSMIDLKINYDSAILEVIKMKFNDFYVNQNKYRSVAYDGTRVKFDGFTDGQIIHVGFRRNEDYIVNVIDDDTVVVDDNNLYNLYYVIDKNSIIKSGFILIDSKKAVTHLIRMEEK